MCRKISVSFWRVRFDSMLELSSYRPQPVGKTGSESLRSMISGPAGAGVIRLIIGLRRGCCDCAFKTDLRPVLEVNGEGLNGILETDLSVGIAS